MAELSRTSNTQPCMAAFAAAVTLLLAERGIRPDYAAGLSLGEYGALHAAGVLDARALLELLAFRGRVMEQSTAGIDTRMSAVLGLGPEEVRCATEEATTDGEIAACANLNCPGQVVIGGHSSAVLRAEALCTQYGAKRCMPLQVSGPFHTPLMEEASRLLGEKFSSMTFGEMQVPVVFNATADVLAPGETVPGLLERQVKSPVLFEQSIRRLEQAGVDTVIEIGPGKVLSGFVRKTAPDIRCLCIEDADSLELVIKEMK